LMAVQHQENLIIERRLQNWIKRILLPRDMNSRLSDQLIIPSRM
jgi:hypothetical protein